MGRHLPAAAVRVGRLREDVEHHLVDGHAQGEHHTDVTVVGEHPVLPGRQCGRRADLRRLLALPGDHEGRPPLAVEREPALGDAAREQHEVPHLDERLVRQTEVRVCLLGPLRPFGAAGVGRLKRDPDSCWTLVRL